MKKAYSQPIACCVFLLVVSIASASTYTLENSTDGVIGTLQKTYVRKGNTLVHIARWYDLGFNEIKLANPGLSVWLPEHGDAVELPTQFVLPDSPRVGIVINLPELRLYQFISGDKSQPHSVSTYPVSIGQENWQTPMAQSFVVKKIENPTWIPPDSIREEAVLAGRFLPSIVPAGPENPLGDYALYLDIPRYLLHGTNKPEGIGMRVTHGCIRLYPEDIMQVYKATDAGTVVTIINQPVKTGWQDGKLFLEVHPPLREYPLTNSELLDIVVEKLKEALGEKPVYVQISLLRKIIEKQNGIPVRVPIMSRNRHP